MLWGEIRAKWKGRQSRIGPRTPGLSCQYSATELGQPDNHQPSQSYICTAHVRLKCRSCMPGSHSACAVTSLLGVDWKFSPSGETEKTTQHGFSHISGFLWEGWLIEIISKIFLLIILLVWYDDIMRQWAEISTKVLHMQHRCMNFLEGRRG